MPKAHFDNLLAAIRPAITVDYMRSSNSTSGNDPIYPEIILGMGLRFIGLGSALQDLADLYGMSLPSARRAINAFLDAIDYNTELEELQVRLPDPANREALDDLAHRWSSCSTAFGLFTHNLGCMDGWFPRTEMPRDVDNQTDYYSGHYQCHGLNIQALCDPDLLFLYVAVAAPGKVNDDRAFNRCSGLLDWLEALPSDFYVIADNAYVLSRRVLVPFDSTELKSEFHRVYNFYLSQLRIRIEMAFGRLTTKWRILRKILAFYNAKNAKVIRVCTKLHNYCIRMQQRDGGESGRVGPFWGETVNPSHHGIHPLVGEGVNQNSEFGFLETNPADDPVDPSTLDPDASRRDGIFADVCSRGLKRPQRNIERNS